MGSKHFITKIRVLKKKVMDALLWLVTINSGILLNQNNSWSCTTTECYLFKSCLTNWKTKKKFDEWVTHEWNGNNKNCHCKISALCFYCATEMIYFLIEGKKIHFALYTVAGARWSTKIFSQPKLVMISVWWLATGITSTTTWILVKPSQ